MRMRENLRKFLTTRQGELENDILNCKTKKWRQAHYEKRLDLGGTYHTYNKKDIYVWRDRHEVKLTTNGH
jgi:hypothetical protein